MAETKTKTGITRVGTVIVPVSDQDRALEFYTETLGFEKGLDVPYAGDQRWLELTIPGAETTVAIVPPPEGKPIGIETNTSFATDDADATHAELRAGGVDVDAEVMRMEEGVPPMFFFRDPDGNRFLIVERD